MESREIFITRFDKERLIELISVAEAFGSNNRQDLKRLLNELDRAKIVESEDVPNNVVTMNSKVVLYDISAAEELTAKLVFPKDADTDEDAISILAPIGSAILGYKEGDIVEWPIPSGVGRIEIRKILYQPEAAGDYHL